MIVLTGADLATGSWMYTTLAFIHGRISIFKMLQHWVLTFFGNLAGSLFMVAIIFGCESSALRYWLAQKGLAYMRSLT
jgi:formate/nitrite transporter FocA (FNT family)